jgi:hypothetical protein
VVSWEGFIAAERRNQGQMDFADHVFLNKPLPEEFGKLAYEEEKKEFTWDVPS